MKFNCFGKNNPCPVCEKADTDCRYNANETDFILCHTFVDARKGEKVNGFVCIKESNGHTASFKPDNSAEYSDEQRRESADKQQQRSEQSKREEQQRLAQLLPVTDRNQQYRRINGILGLSQKHRVFELTKNRGLNSEEIDFAVSQGWLASWKPGLKVEASPSLAGINGGQLTGVLGIAIAAVNSKDEITGFQIASDNRVKFGKYMWLSSASKSGNGPQLPNGELPVFLWKHPEAEQITETWLVEGGLKSLITALKLWFRDGRKDIQIIGAAGANWTSSINAVMEGLGQTNKVVLCPDAGSLSNSGILTNYKKIVEELTTRDYSVNVAWWGQIVKTDSDIDELEDLSGIKFIGLNEFNEQIRIANHVDQFISEQKEEKKENLGWKLWLKTRKFTPDFIVNHKNFSFPVEKIPKSKTIFAIRSGLGTNKTGWALGEVNRNQADGIGSKFIGYRNNLLFQTISRGDQIRINIYHLQKDDGRGMLGDTSVHLAFCLDSIKYVKGYFKGCDIHLDETCSVILHGVNGGTLGEENQAQALRILKQAIQECNNVYLYDGNLSDIYVDAIAKLAPEKKVIKVLNEYKIAPHTIKFVEGIDAEGDIKKRDKSAIVSFLIKDDVKPFIYSDSKAFTDVLYKILTDLGRKGYVLNADTVGEPWAKEFLKDPDKFILQNKPHFFIGSPSMESGISSTIKNYFTHKFSFFAGVAVANSQHQGMFRLRDETITHYVFCPEVSSIRDVNTPRVYSERKLKSILDERILSSAMLASNYSGNESATDIIAKAISRNDDEWFSLSCQLGAIDNYERDHLRECLIHVLREEAGHNVEVIAWDVDDESKQLMKDASDEVKVQRAKEVFNAVPFPTVEKAKDAKSGSPNKETQRRIEKTFLLDKIPGIESEEVWNEEFVLNYHVKDAHFIGQVQKFFLFNNFEIAKKRHEVDWYYKATKEDFFKGCVTGTSHQQLWALQELKFQELIFSDKELCKDSPEVINIWNTVKSRRDLQVALRFDQMPKEQSNGEERTNLIKFLASIIGVTVKSAGQKTTEDGTRKRFHKFNMDALKSAEGTAIINCLTKKFDTWMQSEKAQVSWDIEVILGVAPSQPEQQTEIDTKPIKEAINLQQSQQIAVEEIKTVTTEEIKPTSTITENEFVEVDCPQWEYHKTKGIITGFDEQNRAIVSTNDGQLKVESYWLKSHPRVVEIGNLFDRFKLIKLVKEGVALVQKLSGDKETLELELSRLSYAAV